jgi:hypothetical protein
MAKSPSDMPSDVRTLQTQLRLSRAQCADLHRRLQMITPGAAPAPAPAPITNGLVPLGQRGPEGTASLEDDNRRLRAQLAKAEEVFREEKAKYAALAGAYEEERKQRIDFEQRKASFYKYWMDAEDKVKDLEDQLKRAGIAPRPNYQWLDRGPSLADILTTLLTMVHTDKWSQGQPATALAHELTVYLNDLRGQGRGRR